MKPITTDEFIKRGNKIHNCKYSYEKTDLGNRDENGKVIITCPIHGEFKQEPNNHLRGVGCQKCANNIKKDSEKIIEEIKSIYGDKYIIPDDFEYVNNKIPLHIICPIHGDFYPFYGNFVKMKHGCKKCSCNLYNNDEFVENVKSIYGNLLSYDNVNFKGYRNKVLVKCQKCNKIHDVYPKRLLSGSFKCDCMKSKYTILENNVADKLDKLNIKYIFQYKTNWLKNKEALSLDFYLPEYNVGIECQGRFHFEPYKTDDKKSLKKYHEQVCRDKIKNQLCEDNNVKLIYYSNIKKSNYFSEIYNNMNDIIKEIKKINYGK